MTNERIVILGGGLVGSLLSIYMVKRGFAVEVYEKRSDPRAVNAYAGRSINLALSDRGLLALERAGIKDDLSEVMIPMRGRAVHHTDATINFQPYGKKHQFINSVSRGELNKLLVEKAEKAGVIFKFGHICDHINTATSTLSFINNGKKLQAEGSIIIGADGAFSLLRNAMRNEGFLNYSEEVIAHGYKELTIPADPSGGFLMQPNALHIWPRGQFMLIALPNTDHTFTCTLFLPFEGKQSFESLQNEEDVVSFFRQLFPDATPLIPDLTTQFFANRASKLATIKCYPWSHRKQLLIGDASHAILPFYGQGMNAGFEDCRLLDEMLEDNYPSWEALFSAFEKRRKPDTDAIADLAIDNFVEMRDRVADNQFVWQKKLEALLHERYPEKWIPLYTMVTFSHIPYSQALQAGKKQEQVMAKIREVYPMSTPPEAIDLEKIVDWLD